MTTIACDGRTIACDSLRVAGTERVDTCTKKIKRVGGRAFGFTGDFACFDPAVEWFLAGHEPDKAPKASRDGSWRLVVCESERLLCYIDSLPYAEPFPYPTAFGSGANFAMSAMRLGKTAAEAVEFASTMDVYTGGDIQVIDLAEAVDLRPRLEAAE